MSKQYPGYESKATSRRWAWLPQRDARMDLDLEDDEEAVDELDDEPLDEGPPRHAEDVWALRDVSLAIDAGTRLAVIGQAGCGKTTLVKLLTGVLLPTNGHLVIRGRVNPLFRTIAGLMSPHDTGRQNIVNLARFFRVPVDLARAQTPAIAAFADLEASLDQRVSRLSPGELQRLGTTVALHLDPDILVADESIAPGDPEFEERCYALIRTKASAGLTTIFTGNEVEAMRSRCDRAVLLDEGRVVAHGTLDEVANAMHRLPSSMAGVHGGGGDDISGIIESVTVVSGTEEGITRLDRSDAAEVRIHLKVPEHVEMGMRCTIVLTGTAGVVRITHPTPVVVDEPGDWVFSAPLPPGLLVEDTYAANVSAYDHGQGQPIRMGKVNRAFVLNVVGVESGRPEGATSKSEFELDWPVTRPPAVV